MGNMRGMEWERGGVIGRVRVCVVGDGWVGVGVGASER